MAVTQDSLNKDGGKYPSGESPDPGIALLVKQKTSDGKITCADAHRIANELSLQPSKVGTALDHMGVRLSRCQLGLYGHSPSKKIVKPAANISPMLKQAIANALDSGTLSCFSVWAIAKKSGVSRMEVSSACEAMGVKIKPCQLGAF